MVRLTAQRNYEELLASLSASQDTQISLVEQPLAYLVQAQSFGLSKDSSDFQGAMQRCLNQFDVTRDSPLILALLLNSTPPSIMNKEFTRIARVLLTIHNEFDAIYFAQVTKAFSTALQRSNIKKKDSLIKVLDNVWSSCLKHWTTFPSTEFLE